MTSRKSDKRSPPRSPPVPTAAPIEGCKRTICSTDASGEKMIGEIYFASVCYAMRWLRESVLPPSGERSSGPFLTPTNIKEQCGIKRFDLRIVSG